MAAEICSARAGLYKSWQRFRRMCAFFLFKNKEYCREFFNFNLSLSLFVRVVCWRLKCSLSKQEIVY
jgi:hypothetical protein